MPDSLTHYIIAAAPTALLVIAHFLRTEKRLTRIELLLQLIISNNLKECSKSDIFK